MILAGLGGIILIEIYAAVMQREFQNTNNRVGKGFAILGIYLFVVCYCKSSTSSPSQTSEWSGLLLTTIYRWHAQQYDMDLRRRSPAYQHAKQSHGPGRCVPFHRQRRQ